MTKSLDLGCGEQPRNPFNANELFGVDVRDNLNRTIREADLAIEPIPYEDSAFDFVTAFDFIEHIPRLIYCPKRRYPFVELMNEIYRVLKMGGVFFSRTPCHPFASAFRDPTHVNFITDETFTLYFDDVNRVAQGYGFTGSFKILEQYTEHNIWLITVMQKV
jgi:SAM-dependent methyltransferase